MDLARTRHRAFLPFLCVAIPLALGPSAASAGDDGVGVEYINGHLFLDQGWSRGDREGFYYTSQGSQLIPYAWFLALERADGSAPFYEGDGFERYGYLKDPLRHEKNPDDLPIGFVKDIGSKTANGTANDECEFIGLTCAACHTALFVHGGHEVYIDGAPATSNMYELLRDLSAALAATAGDPARLQAFEAKLENPEDRNGGACVPDAKAYQKDFEAPLSLQQSLDAHAQHLDKLLNPKGDTGPLDASDWGPARLDAIGIIVNQLFLGLGLLGDPNSEELKEVNLGRVNAPVSYPFLWDGHHHNQVQWNGVSRIPIVRNITEVLGVFADFEANGDETDDTGLPTDIDHTVRARGLDYIETQMADLRSPVWPADLFDDPIDEAKRAAGEELFEKDCRLCHSAVPRDSAIPNIRAIMTPLAHEERGLEPVHTDGLTLTNFADHQIVGTNIEDIDQVVDCYGEGTPPSLWARFKAALNPLEPKPSNYGPPPPELLLRPLVPKFFGDGGTWIALREGLRSMFLPETILNRCAYKGRPLDGIWATAPYLHNGSVPNLDELLKPPAERVAKFCVSTRPAFDPVAVGLEVKGEAECDGQMLDTQRPARDGARDNGNSNKGHDYGFLQEDGTRRDYTAEERAALVEYQKSL